MISAGYRNPLHDGDPASKTALPASTTPRSSQISAKLTTPPPYLRIADELRRRIAEHVWEPGDRLPSRSQISQEYGVGENVVHRAQELLISQGVLEGRAGSGTYVAEPRQRSGGLVVGA